MLEWWIFWTYFVVVFVEDSILHDWPMNKREVRVWTLKARVFAEGDKIPQSGSGAKLLQSLHKLE